MKRHEPGMTRRIVAHLWMVLPALAMLCSVASGSGLDDKEQREHQAVKAYINNGVAAQSRLAGAPLPQITKATMGSLPKTGATQAQKDRKSYFMNGNKIATQLFNYGGIAPGFDALRAVNNVVWHNLDYAFQFCPIVGAAVPNPSNPTRRIHIISDGLWDYQNLREVNPTGDTLWQWQPLPGYADPDQPDMASNPSPDDDGDGKPDSWPRSWYSGTLGKYVWPGYLSQDVLSSDLEVYWAMDDRFNMEFPYYPFPGDSSRKGIGVQVDGRAFQWSNALAENTMFFVYTITNISPTSLDSVFFGIYGDADLGGGAPENGDDNGYFVPPYDSSGRIDDVPVYSRSMVYFWDPDMKGARSLPLGFLGCKFLESPGNPNDSIDNDGDGMLNERQDDGMDNDGDWNVLLDDLGVDGVANTDDPGEGNGFPDAGIRLPDGSLDPLQPGEPNYELTDLDESDQIGLTSFNSWTWNGDKISNDESMWNRSIPRNFGFIQQSADIVFIFGSGYISLRPAETKRVSMALLLGWDLDELLTTAKTVQTIYNKNYQFYRPPITPKVTAVAGDRKVTLFWDTAAEQSLDPLTGYDFEGYVIYRSTDPSFNDIQTVTDGKGSGFLSEPLKSVDGREAKFDVAMRGEPYTDANGNGQYDLGESFRDFNKSGTRDLTEDYWQGYSPVAYEDRGLQYYLGDNTGLVHTYVDSNNVINGQTYFYAVVAYDHGDTVAIPPTECTKKVTVDPITAQYTLDVNTVMVVPGPRASGYVEPVIESQDVVHTSGTGTGTVEFTILDDLAVRESGEFHVTFSDTLTPNGEKKAGRNYSVLDLGVVTETITPYDTNYSALKYENLSNDSYLKVTGLDGTAYVEGRDYLMNLRRGSIRRMGTSTMPADTKFAIQYRYFPIFQSQNLNGEDANAVFGGVKLVVKDDPVLAYDSTRSRWIDGNPGYMFTAQLHAATGRVRPWPADYQIRFSASNIDSAFGFFPSWKKVPVRYSVTDVTTGAPQRILTYLVENTATRNNQWDPGEGISLFKPGATGVGTDSLTWKVIVTPPTDPNVSSHVPTDGDVLLLKTLRPFQNDDAFALKTSAATVDQQKASTALDNIFVVPNPYVGYSIIEPTNWLPGATRGERRIYFENLPSRCTIRIFTINGDLVQTLEHDAGLDHAREYWNLLNRDGFSVAYGIYVAHIDAPGVGEKILKFALIK